MNTGPSGQPNFAQNQPDPLTTVRMPDNPAASQASVQPAFALATRGPVPPPPQPSNLPPSPFVQAFLSNAIFGDGSPPYPFALGTGIRAGRPGGR